jgi:multisubunit Na+/H+ antiporter MnhE subunit
MPRWTEPLTWWIVLFGGYLSLISKASLTELVVGTVAAAAGAGVAVAARRALLPRAGHGSQAVPLSALGLLPVQIVTDAARLARPRVSGTFAEVPARGGPAALVLSASPGTYVVGADTEHGTVTVHRIATGPDRLERALIGEHQ